jgi:hypothetical protein
MYFHPTLRTDKKSLMFCKQEYKTPEQLDAKLQLAINNTQGFGLV